MVSSSLELAGVDEVDEVLKVLLWVVVSQGFTAGRIETKCQGRRGWW
jgi:hypothetical protein